MIRAVTFDLWDTLVIDDSDEPARAAAGLPSKAEAREQAFVGWAGPQVGAQRAREALEAANGRFTVSWKQRHRTPHIRDRLLDAVRALELVEDAGFERVVKTFAEMEVQHPPMLAPGAAEMLETLAARYPLAIISDAIVTPGAGLRRILAGHGLLHHFTMTVFSDEAGAAKPDPLVFERVAGGLGIGVAELVHVGDREPNDIAGPLRVGAGAVLYTGVVDRGSAGTKASVVCAHHRDLAGLIAGLEA